MELEERLSYLENVRDWQGLVEELEKGIAGSSAGASKAAFHLQLGRILETKFLAGVKALKHFQDAYKLNPALVESLESARMIYWDLGKLNMVQKLLELELKARPDGPNASVLLVELGDVLSGVGDYEKAAATYARALGVSGGKNADASAALEDIQVEAASWQERVASLLREANDLPNGTPKGRLLMRAARIARRYAPDELEGLLARAYGADPRAKEIAALYEGMLAEQGRFDAIESTQKELLSGSDRTERAALALTFGTRWLSRHQNVETGARFLEEALKIDAQNEGAFHYLRDFYGKKGGDWDRVLTLAEEASTRVGDNGNATFLLAQAGTIAWRQLGNLIRARSSFERLSAVSPEHPQLRAFELQIGETLKPVHGPVPTNDVASKAKSMPPLSGGPSSAVPTARPDEVQAAALESERVTSLPTETTPQPKAAVRSAPPPAMPEPSPPPPVAAREPSAPPPPPVAAAAIPVADSAEGDDAEIAKLRAQLDKQEQTKRFNEYVKTLVQLAVLVPDVSEKIALYMKAADLYVSKFANQAEAVKAYEAVVALEPDNAVAIDYLRQMYERRRDWEKLLGLQRREADGMAPGPERAAKFLGIAKLATERVKKPEVCIDLWQEVLNDDPSNGEALGALGGLYERSKEFDKLASVLEKQAEVTYDAPAKIQILTKLGTIYGDRLNNDEGAVAAWRSLLTLDPNDRRAQDALKKKYLTLGRWDDLEVFYAESGKWDEFIRVLEQQEAKETDPPAKISLLFKIAQLWAEKKQKNDRAAKAYEKVLDLEPQNLQAAEALIPIYSAAGNSKALANAIEVKLGHEEDPPAKLELYREVAALYEGKVKDPQKAFDRYLAAFELFPSDDRTTADVERAAKSTGGWDQVIASYSRAVESSDSQGDLMTAVALRLRLGRVLVDEVNRVDDALVAYRAVYEAENENPDALSALERLYRQTGRYSDLLGIYEQKRDLAGDPTEKKRINYEIAKLFETEVKDLDKAIATYDAILADEPSDARSLAALDVLYGQLGRWEPYVETLRRRIELDLGEAELIDLKFRLGQTLEKHVEDHHGALENYREILFLDAQHEGARMALEALMQKSELRGEAAAILETIYEERGEWPKLISALEILSANETDVTKRVALERKISRISGDHLKDYGRAFTALATALKDDPAQVETRNEIERVADASQSWRQLVTLYSEIADGLSDAALSRDYWMRLAAIDERLGDVDAAALGYTKVLGLDASDVEALAALEQLFTRTQRWPDLIGVVQRRIEQTPDAEGREAFYVTIANIYDEKLAQPDDAVAAYRKVLELDPASPRALASLDALFTRQKMWGDLAENLEAQLALATTDDAQIGFMLRLAGLRESEMGQIDAAIEGYRTVLERDATNPQALAALERLGHDAKYELTIADLLEPLYRQLGDYEKLIGVHEVQVRRSEDPSRRVELLHQVAQLYEEAAGDQNASFATLSRALKEDPANEATQQGLDRVARATGRFADLAMVFEKLASETQDPTLASSLYAMSARVYENDIGNVEVAIGLYRKVLEIDETNLAAAQSLERLFRTTERYQDLAVVLQRKADIVDEPLDKKDALFQAAAINEDVLNDAESAIGVYKKVLELDGDDVRAIDALVRRYLGLSSTGFARIPWAAVGTEGEAELAQGGVTVRCLLRADGSLPESEGEDDLVALVARSY